MKPSPGCEYPGCPQPATMTFGTDFTPVCDQHSGWHRRDETRAPVAEPGVNRDAADTNTVITEPCPPVCDCGCCKPECPRTGEPCAICNANGRQACRKAIAPRVAEPREESWPHTGHHRDCLRCQQDHFDALKREARGGAQIPDSGNRNAPQDTTTRPCLPDCEGDCPVCLPPEEYDRLHGKTTGSTHRLNVSDQEYAALLKCHERDRGAEYAKGERAERARIERIIESQAVFEAGWTEGTPGIVRYLLAAIQGGDDLMAQAVAAAEAHPGVEVPRIPGEDNRCADCRTNDTDCTGKCEAYS